MEWFPLLLPSRPWQDGPASKSLIKSLSAADVQYHGKEPVKLLWTRLLWNDITGKVIRKSMMLRETQLSWIGFYSSGSKCRDRSKAKYTFIYFYRVNNHCSFSVMTNNHINSCSRWWLEVDLLRFRGRHLQDIWRLRDTDNCYGAWSCASGPTLQSRC